MNKKQLALAIGAAVALYSFQPSSADALRLGDSVPYHSPMISNSQNPIDTAANVEAATEDALRQDIVVSNVDMNELLSKMAGEWYDVRNYHHLTIDPAVPTINGCEILSYKGTGNLDKGTAEFTIKEASGPKAIKISWVADPNTPINSCINIDGYPTYRHSPNNYHAESILGFHLWMSPSEVREKTGEDGKYLTAEQTRAMTGIYAESHYFEDDVLFTYSPYNEMIDRIILLKNSPLTFDRYQLSAKSSLQDFATAYGWATVPNVGDVVEIASHQYISFKHYPQSVVLTIYPNE